MNETTTRTAPDSEFDLLPCSFCGKQPELVEKPHYLFRCQCTDEMSVATLCCSTSVKAAASWNRINDMSAAESPAEDISPSRTLHGYREFSAGPGLLARLKPCPFCGAQPDILECPNPSDYGYFVRCLCHTADTFAETILQRTPEDAIAVWNRRAEPKGIFTALEKRLASFFRLYDFGYFFLMSIFMLIPFTSIIEARGSGFDYLSRCFIVCQSVIFSATVVCMFAFIRWMESDEEKDSSL